MERPNVNPFKNSPIKGPGHAKVQMLLGRVTHFDPKRWTATVYCGSEGRTFTDVPVGSSYVDYRGAGIFARPVIKSQVLLAVPGDTSPPAVVAFMPAMRVSDPAEEEEGVAAGTKSQAQSLAEAKSGGAVQRDTPPSAPGYSSGRPDYDDGDIILRNAEGNFLVLYNSGILAVGSGPLCQTIYLPLTNRILQVAGETDLKTPMGSVQWGLRKIKSNPTQRTEVFRVYADDKQADIRIRTGQPEVLGEPGNSPVLPRMGALGVDESKAALEVVISPQGFHPETGDPLEGAGINSVYRVLVTKDGNMVVRMAGSLLVSANKNLELRATEELRVDAKRVLMKASEEALLQGGETLRLGAKSIIVNGGKREAAAVGDLVSFGVTNAPIVGTLNGQSFTGVVSFTTPPCGQIVASASGATLKLP